MPESLEFALTRTLTEAADAAPEPSIDLLPRVDTGFRKRRNRRYSIVAGVAAFAVMLGSAIWAGGAFAPPEPKVVKLTAVPAGEEPPVAKEWPEAYHKIPARLPDGRKIQPRQLINKRELLVATEAGPQRVDELWVIDIQANTARFLVRLPVPPPSKQRVFASHFTVGSGHVVWLDTYSVGSRSYHQIWRISLAGGKAAMVAVVPALGGLIEDRLVVYRGMVYYSNMFHGDVYDVPLAGGDARIIPGSETYQIVSWPWIGKPGRCDVWPDRSGHCESSPRGSRKFAELRNVETGERRSVTLPDPALQGLVCGVTYCHAVTPGQRKQYVFTRDAHWNKLLPGFTGWHENVPIRDRFLILRYPHPNESLRPVPEIAGQLLYDLKTGKYADLGLHPESEGNVLPARHWDPDSRLVFWSVDGQTAYAILDLGVIR